MKFNIFRVLEKDDKELIHSSFLKYLLENWGKYFYNSLFKKPHLDFNIIELEKSYSKQRFDLEITSRDGKEIIVVENKFKSFPNRLQLANYDKILKKHHAGKTINKFLLCFDSETVSFETKQWNVITYSQLLESINIFLEKESSLSIDERVFVEHYASFLSEYFSEFNYHIQNIDKLLRNASEKDNKFWLRLFNSMIANKIEQKFNELNEQITLVINPGNTAVPLLNIIPSKWKVSGVEKLIQFQGNDVKFYIHTGNKTIVQEYIDKLQSEFNTSNGELKKLNNRDANSFFIYKEKLTNILPYTLDIIMIVDYLMDFYNRIDKRIKE